MSKLRSYFTDKELMAMFKVLEEDYNDPEYHAWSIVNINGKFHTIRKGFALIMIALGKPGVNIKLMNDCCVDKILYEDKCPCGSNKLYESCCGKLRPTPPCGHEI